MILDEFNCLQHVLSANRAIIRIDPSPSVLGEIIVEFINSELRYDHTNFQK